MRTSPGARIITDGADVDFKSGLLFRVFHVDKKRECARAINEKNEKCLKQREEVKRLVLQEYEGDIPVLACLEAGRRGNRDIIARSIPTDIIGKTVISSAS